MLDCKVRPNPAVIVHHIIPITKDFTKALKLDNLESLCLECHNKVHPEGKPSFERRFLLVM